MVGLASSGYGAAAAAAAARNGKLRLLGYQEEVREEARRETQAHMEKKKEEEGRIVKQGRPQTTPDAQPSTARVPGPLLQLAGEDPGRPGCPATSAPGARPRPGRWQRPPRVPGPSARVPGPSARVPGRRTSASPGRPGYLACPAWEPSATPGARPPPGLGPSPHRVPTPSTPGCPAQRLLGRGLPDRTGCPVLRTPGARTTPNIPACILGN
nr:basic proline-rich protein-like [Aegilops tauschii subsp. strangulata]